MAQRSEELALVRRQLADAGARATEQAHQLQQEARRKARLEERLAEAEAYLRNFRQL